jgi:hypothetical protein
MYQNNKLRFFFYFAMLLLLSGLTFLGCNKQSQQTGEGTGAGLIQGGGTGGGTEGGTVGGTGGGGGGGSNNVACGNTGVIGPQGTEITPAADKTPYPYSYGSVHSPIRNAVAMSGNFTASAIGSWATVSKGGTPLGKVFNLKGGQILVLKLVEKDGGVFLIAGTMSNLQVCTVDQSSGVQANTCKVFDRVGGVNSVDVGANDIYFTTLAGDFGSIGWDMMQSQSGCARLYYLASDNPSSKTNNHFRAFRIAAGNTVVFATRNNTGSAAFNLNTFIANLMDWEDFAFWRILDRETKLYSLNPNNGKVTPLDIGDAAYQYHVDDLVAGPGGKVFASYWAPRLDDIALISACKATAAGTPCGMQTPHADITYAVLAYFLNTKSGILSIDGNNVTPHEVPPFVTYNASNGCPAEGLGQWIPNFLAWPPPVCARIPNFGLYYMNRISTAGDSIYMRGITGYVRLQGNTLEDKSASTLLPPAGDPGAGVPFAFSANSIFSAVMGVFANATSVGYATEMATYGSSPMSLSTTAGPSMYSNPAKLDIYLIGGGSHYAYFDYDTETRAIDVLDPTKFTDFKRTFTPAVGQTSPLPYRVGYVAAQADPNNPGKDRLATWNPAFNPGSPSTQVNNVAFYESDDPNPKWVTTAPAPNITGNNTADRPIVLQDDFGFATSNTLDKNSNVTHNFMASYLDWKNKQTTLIFSSYVGDMPNGTFGIIGVDHTGDDYKIYLQDDQMNVNVISLHYNSSNYYNSPNDPTKANIDFFDVPPAPVTVQYKNAVGVAAGDGQVYFLDKDANLQVYNAAGNFIKQITHVIPLQQGESVAAGISSQYHKGKFFTTAVVLEGPTSPLPNGVRFNFNIIDVDNETNVVSYDFEYFLLHVAGDKLYAGSVYNGSDVFDMSMTPAQSSFQGTSINIGGGTP